MHLSVVVPCYNESANIAVLHARLSAACQPYAPYGYELVLVDDGSHDNTWEQIRQLAAQDRHVVGVSLSRNHGHQLALTAGLAHARGERVLIIDADLQDPPELLPQMMVRMDEGFDVVYGQRAVRKGETFFKKTTAALYYRVLKWFSDVPIPLDTGDFRLISRKVVDALSAMPESARFIRGMVSLAGYRQIPITYERASRHAGESHYSLSKMARLAVDGITGFSIRPLRIPFFLGVLITLVSLGYGACVALRMAEGESVHPMGATYAIFGVLHGMQWIFIGVMGEYLGRIYIESKRRPLYFVQEVVGR